MLLRACANAQTHKSIHCFHVQIMDADGDIDQTVDLYNGAFYQDLHSSLTVGSIKCGRKNKKHYSTTLKKEIVSSY